MNPQTLIGTAASASALLACLAVSVRWIHRWLTRLENVVSVVETRSQQLEPNGGSSLRDDVTGIRNSLTAHSLELAALHLQVDALALTAARHETEE
jgi:hypothetical protein